MNKQEVLLLVDSIMHEFASPYREDARKRVESKFSSDNTTHEEIKPCSNKECDNYNLADREGCNCMALHPERVEFCPDYYRA